MALNISEEVKAGVTKDRANGMSLNALVEKWGKDGVTKNWVRQHTKAGKKQESVSSVVINSVLPLAVRKIGVKPSELYPIYLEHYGTTWCEVEERHILNMTQSQKSYIRSKVKEKAKKQGLTACFIPEWMDRNNPKESNQLMLTLANDLYEIIEDKVVEYKASFPQEKDTSWSIRNELYSLVVSGHDPSGVVKRCERNADVASFLKGE